MTHLWWHEGKLNLDLIKVYTSISFFIPHSLRLLDILAEPIHFLVVHGKLLFRSGTVLIPFLHKLFEISEVGVINEATILVGIQNVMRHQNEIIFHWWERKDSAHGWCDKTNQKVKKRNVLFTKLSNTPFIDNIIVASVFLFVHKGNNMWAYAPLTMRTLVYALHEPTRPASSN